MHAPITKPIIDVVLFGFFLNVYKKKKKNVIVLSEIIYTNFNTVMLVYRTSFMFEAIIIENFNYLLLFNSKSYYLMYNGYIKKNAQAVAGTWLQVCRRTTSIRMQYDFSRKKISHYFYHYTFLTFRPNDRKIRSNDFSQDF